MTELGIGRSLRSQEDELEVMRRKLKELEKEKKRLYLEYNQAIVAVDDMQELVFDKEEQIGQFKAMKGIVHEDF